MIKPTCKGQIERNWYLFDAKDQILGRFASKIAPILVGKKKSYFARNMDCGDYIVVINAKHVKLTGKKPEEKKYTSYSGYPGGLTVRKFSEVNEKFPEKIVHHAVYNMLPKNKMRDIWMSRLHIFGESEHKFADKFNKKTEAKGKK